MLDAGVSKRSGDPANGGTGSRIKMKAVDLKAEMEEYLRELQRSRLNKPPREALAYAAGGEIFGPEMHLAFNTAPYLVIGEYVTAIDEAGVRILEIGCGTGHDTAYLKRRFIHRASITGTDRVAALPRYASETYSGPGLDFMSADACSLPFRAMCFDMVISIYSIIHTMNRDGAGICLSEISRVLKPGGTLIFTTPSRKLSQDLYQHNPEDNPWLFFCHLHRTEYYREDLEALILSPETGPERLFSSVSIGGIANTALQPIWKEVLAELGSRRFSGPGKEGLLPGLARRILPQSFKARYFFRKIRQTCRKRNITLRDIARGIRHYPEVSDEAVEHFIVIARKE